ncbi:MAG: hypothetical protein U9Q88_18715 [Bacillota bacterium]|nr:hypothetical protein [Bacillota bacterium]
MSFYYQKKHGHCDDMKKEIKCELELKEKCKNDKSMGKMVVDFEYDRNGRGPEPNLFLAGSPEALPLTVGQETQVASISFKDVQKRSKIELKGIFHILTTTAPTSGVLNFAVIRIRKVVSPVLNLAAAEEIYRTGPSQLSPNANTVTILPVLDVDDDFKKCEENVTYILTVTIPTGGGTGAYSLVNPITFTGTEYNK